MREVSARGVVLLLAGPLLTACGAFLSVSDDPASTTDPSDDGGTDEATTQDGGAPDTSAPATDACAQAATCAPELMRQMGGSVLRLVAAGNALYAAVDGSQASVFRVDLAPPFTPLDLDRSGVVPEEFRGDSNIAVDPSGAVFWGTANGLRRRDANAVPDASNDAGITTMTELGAPVAGVRIIDGRLHFTVAGPAGGAAANTGHLATCTLPFCTDVQQVAYTPAPIDVIAIGATRFWMGSNAQLTKLTFQSVSGTIGTEQALPSRMVTDGTRILWSTVDALLMYTVATHELVDLLPAPTSAASRVNGVILDSDGTLYVTQEKAVRRCVLADAKCTFVDLASNASIAVDLAVDATFLYWGTLDGSILRLRE